jgi:hypothetical protein
VVRTSVRGGRPFSIYEMEFRSWFVRSFVRGTPVAGEKKHSP